MIRFASAAQYGFLAGMSRRAAGGCRAPMAAVQTSGTVFPKRSFMGAAANGWAGRVAGGPLPEARVPPWTTGTSLHRGAISHADRESIFGAD